MFNSILCRPGRLKSSKFVSFNGSGGANNYDMMLEGAARGCHQNLCHLAGASHDFNRMLFGAIRTGCHDVCILAIEWGATDFDGMLCETAYNGNRDLCYLAKRFERTILIRCCLVQLNDIPQRFVCFSQRMGVPA